MTQQDLGYGPCLTDEEYQRRLIALQEAMPESPTPEQERENFRRQQEIAIDHRLGIDFPKEKRDAMWAAWQRMDRRRWQMYVLFLIRRMFRRSTPGERGLGDLVAFSMKEYSKVLSQEELERFFDLRSDDTSR